MLNGSNELVGLYLSEGFCRTRLRHGRFGKANVVAGMTEQVSAEMLSDALESVFVE